MPRLGKKTLYLDLDALARMEEALSVLPGKPSLSSYLNDELPKLALKLEEAVKPFRPAPLLELQQEPVKKPSTRKPKTTVK